MKVLKITTPTHLWTILKRKEEIFESNKDIKRFMFITEKFIKGCSCGSADNKTLMDNCYKLLSEDVTALNLLKENLDYEDIIFEY